MNGGARVAGVAVLVVLAACGGGGPASDGGLDATHPLTDARVDAPSGRDGSVDAGGTDVDAGPDAGDPIWDRVVTELCMPLAQLDCDAMTSCGCPSPLDPTMCTSIKAGNCESWLDARHAALDDGTATIDEAAIADCLAMARDERMRCQGVTQALVLRCSQAVPLAAAIGDACSTPGAPCASGAGVCDGATCRALVHPPGVCGWCAPPAVCVASHCVTPGGAGAPCTTDDECTAPNQCAGGTCGELAPLGASCTGFATCQPPSECVSGTCVASTGCMRDRDCGPSTFCFGTDATQCVARGAVGEPCEVSDLECAADAYCNLATDLCTALPADGEPCHVTTAVACAAASCPSWCAAGLACMGGICAAAPAPGAPCSDDERCAPGSYCNFDRTCQAQAPLGASCDFVFDACAGNATCDSTGTCVARHGAGASCTTMGECSIGLVCSPAGTCAAPPALGTSCAPACDPGVLCDLNECGPNAVCARRATGGSCSWPVCGTVY